MRISDINADDILSSVGLQTRRTAVDYLLPALGVFGAGILVGAGVGLLFAPKAGVELRHQIGDFARRRQRRGDQPMPVEAREAAE